MDQVIFPDVEKTFVTGLTSALLDRVEAYAEDVYVATIKPAPDYTPYPSRIVTIRSDGGSELEEVTRKERVAVTVWCDTYADASDLSRLVAALSKSLTGTDIKAVKLALSPVRVDEKGSQECRYMVFEVIVKGSTL